MSSADLKRALERHPLFVETPRNTSFRTATFAMGGKPVIAVEKDDVHATFALSRGHAQHILDETWIQAEPIRNGEDLIGVRVDLRRIDAEQLELLITRTGERGTRSNRKPAT